MIVVAAVLMWILDGCRPLLLGLFVFVIYSLHKRNVKKITKLRSIVLFVLAT